MTEAINSIKESMEGIGEQVSILQQKNADLEGKHDGLVEGQIKNLSESITKGLEDVQAMKAANDAREKAYKERMDFVEKIASSIGNGGSSKGSPAAELYRKAGGVFLRTGEDIDLKLYDDAFRAVAEEKMNFIDEDEILRESKTLRTSEGSQGGYWLMPDRRTERIERQFETSPMRRISNVITTTTSMVEWIVDDNEAASGGWTSEEGVVNNTDTPEIGTLTIPIHAQYAQPRATQKMLDDAGFDIEGWLQRKVDDIFTRTENTAFVVGDGAGKPKGFLSYAAWAAAGVYERGKLEQVNSGSNGAVTYDGFIDMHTSLLEFYQPNAVWLMNRTLFADVLKLKGTGNEPLINRDQFKEAVELTILGKPVIFASDMQTKATDSLSVAYGDFGIGYTIADRLGITVQRDPYTDKPRVKFYTTKRVGGGVTNFDAIKIQKLAA